MVATARRAYASGITKDVAFRREQLEKLDSMLVTNEAVLAEAIKQDLRKPYFEAIITEIEFVRNELHAILNNLESWARPQKASKSLMTLFDSVYLHPEPYGVTLIIGAWNYPLMLTLCPMIGAIASGNTIIVKPSELAPATSKALAALIPRYLDKVTLLFLCSFKLAIELFLNNFYFRIAIKSFLVDQKKLRILLKKNSTTFFTLEALVSVN